MELIFSSAHICCGTKMATTAAWIKTQLGKVNKNSFLATFFKNRFYTSVSVLPPANGLPLTPNIAKIQAPRNLVYIKHFYFRTFLHNGSMFYGIQDRLRIY